MCHAYGTRVSGMSAEVVRPGGIKPSFIYKDIETVKFSRKKEPVSFISQLFFYICTTGEINEKLGATPKKFDVFSYLPN